MTTHLYDGARRRLTYTGPLIVEVVIRDDNGDEVTRLDRVALLPGESLTWTYPQQGLVVTSA